MKFFVIYNPVSGSRKFDRGGKIKKYLADKQITYDWLETQAIARQDFSRILQGNYERILVAGGDGTVREVAEFLIIQKIKTPLAIIPCGSANILAFTLGIPLFPLSACLNFALSASAQPLDAIQVNRERYALICAGQGYDTSLMNNATRSLKKLFGFGAYIISFIKTFFTYFNHRYTIVVDGNRYETVGKLAIVLNGLSILGLPLDKKISPSDGTLDLIVFNPRTFWDIMGALFHSLWRGVKRAPRMQAFSGKEISVNQRKGKYIQVDGEVFSAKNLQLSIVPAAINVVYSKKL